MQLSSASTAMLGALLALALSSGGIPAQVPLRNMMAAEPLLRRAEEKALAPVDYTDARLQQMMDELARTSPTAASMLLTIRKLGFPMTVGTFGDLEQEMEEEYRAWTRSSQSSAGYMAPVVRAGSAFSGEITTIKINLAVNLALLDQLFEAAPAEVPSPAVPWDEIRRLEMLAVLGHELVHAYGLAVSGGDPRVGCHDPAEGESTQVSCVMIGENIVRSEIGAPLDWDYGFPSATLLAQRYASVAARQRALQEIAAFRHPFRPERFLELPERKPLD